MHVLTIWFGPHGSVVPLQFKEPTRAAKVRDEFLGYYGQRTEHDIVSAEDDFGRAIAIPVSEVTGMLLEDTDKSAEGLITQGLHNTRTQAKAQQRAAADPEIRAAQSFNGGGLPMHSPFMGGRN